MIVIPVVQDQPTVNGVWNEVDLSHSASIASSPLSCTGLDVVVCLFTKEIKTSTIAMWSARCVWLYIVYPWSLYQLGRPLAVVR